jgi:hypothetical protein
MYLTSQLHKVFVATRHDQFSRGNKRRAPEISIHVSAAYSIVAAITARFAHGFRYPFQTSSTPEEESLHVGSVGKLSLLSLPLHVGTEPHDSPAVRRKGASFATLFPLFQRLPTVGVSSNVAAVK